MEHSDKTIRLTTQSVIDRMLYHCHFHWKDMEETRSENQKVQILEPSAGKGALVEGIFREYSHTHIEVDCVELNQNFRKELNEKGFNLVGNDFFLFEPQKKYDYVIACPNFQENIDTKHIMKMYDCVGDRGRVVTLSSPEWMTKNSERCIEFRKWLEDKSYFLEMLPDNLFKENYETVPTMIMVIDKIKRDDLIIERPYKIRYEN